jgi:hypothetical protein
MKQIGKFVFFIIFITLSTFASDSTILAPKVNYIDSGRFTINSPSGKQYVNLYSLPGLIPTNASEIERILTRQHILVRNLQPLERKNKVLFDIPYLKRLAEWIDRNKINYILAEKIMADWLKEFSSQSTQKNIAHFILNKLFNEWKKSETTKTESYIFQLLDDEDLSLVSKFKDSTHRDQEISVYSHLQNSLLSAFQEFYMLEIVVKEILSQTKKNTAVNNDYLIIDPVELFEKWNKVNDVLREVGDIPAHLLPSNYRAPIFVPKILRETDEFGIIMALNIDLHETESTAHYDWNHIYGRLLGVQIDSEFDSLALHWPSKETLSSYELPQSLKGVDKANLNLATLSAYERYCLKAKESLLAASPEAKYRSLLVNFKSLPIHYSTATKPERAFLNWYWNWQEKLEVTFGRFQGMHFQNAKYYVLNLNQTLKLPQNVEFSNESMGEYSHFAFVVWDEEKSSVKVTLHEKTRIQEFIIPFKRVAQLLNAKHTSLEVERNCGSNL